MEIDVREGIKNIDIPVYMMHGVEDEVVSQSQVLKLFDSLTTNKKF
jgi:esterase/lipase